MPMAIAIAITIITTRQLVVTITGTDGGMVTKGGWLCAGRQAAKRPFKLDDTPLFNRPRTRPRPRSRSWIWERGLEGRCLQRPGAAVRFRLGDPDDALSCISRPRLDEGRSGSPPKNRGRGRF